MSRMRIQIALLLSVVLIAPALPQQPTTPSPTYRVELLVFRATSALGGAENWAAGTNARGFGASGESVEGETASGGPVGRFARMLGPGELQLAEVVRKLRDSDQYEPVAHVGWMQTASAWGTRAGFPISRLGVRVPGLSGTVFLERGQFLHLGLALDYEMAEPPAGLGAGPGTAFSIHESRRVRFYERNYYDHPAFGVIALVTPAQGPRPAGR
jgi:hypothetical protein